MYGSMINGSIIKEIKGTMLWQPLAIGYGGVLLYGNFKLFSLPVPKQFCSACVAFLQVSCVDLNHAYI